MSSRFLFACFVAGAVPYLAIVVIFVHFMLRRARWEIACSRGKKTRGFCPSTAALGMMLLFMQVFVRPTLQYVLEQKQDEGVEEDDEGDPEGKMKHLDWQLRRIRRGEPVDDLVLRL